MLRLLILILVAITLASQLESYDESDITIKCPSLSCPKVKCGSTKCTCKADKKHKPKPPPQEIDGIWKCVSKASCFGAVVFSGQHDRYAVVNTTGDISFELYLGSIENPRVPNPITDGIPPFFEVPAFFSQVVRTEEDGRVLLFDFSAPPINANPAQVSVVVQDVNGPLAGYAITSCGGILKRIDALPDNIRPLDDIGLDFPDPDSRVFMFDQIIDHINRDNDATNDYHKHSFYVGDTAAETLLQKIKTEGVQHGPVLIANVLTTIENSGVTTFIVNRYPHIHQSSDVTLSGFRGAYAALNGNYQILINGIKQIDRAGEDKFSDVTKYEFAFSVPFDSSQLPAFDPSAHGPGFVQPDRYGPITEEMRYNQLVSAIIEYQTTVLPELTHGELDVAYVPLDVESPSPRQWRVVRTFEELQGFLSAGAQTTNANQRFGGRTGSVFTGNWLPRLIGSGPIGSAFLSTSPLNEPFVELGGAFPFIPVPGIFNTIAANYLLPDSLRYLYFRINPNTPAFLPIHSELQAEFGATYPAFNHVGSQLEGMMSPNIPFVDPAPDGDWSPFFDAGAAFPPNFAFLLPLVAQTNYAGIIDPQYTGGKKIGYIFFYDFSGQPGQAPYSIMRDWQFGTPGLKIRGIQPYVQVMSAFMRYFNEEEVDDVIFDIRGNVGGRMDGWDNLFGADRRGANLSTSFSTENQRPPLFGKDYESWDPITQQIVPGDEAGDGGFNLNNVYARFTRPSEVRQVSGDDSVFTNGRLFVLTDYASLSAGDQFQRYFVGDNFDGALGDDTQMYVAGNAGSILIGYNNVQEAIAVTASSDEFMGPGGFPVSPLSWGSEGGTVTNYANISSIERADVMAHHGTLIPPLSNHYQDTSYGEFGFIPNALPPFPNKGPTDTNVPQSWRDAWLEETIRGACADEFAQPSVAQTMGHSSRVVTTEEAEAVRSESRANMGRIAEAMQSGALDEFVEALRRSSRFQDLPSLYELVKNAQADE